jgi:hypothetical protein
MQADYRIVSPRALPAAERTTYIILKRIFDTYSNAPCRVAGILQGCGFQKAAERLLEVALDAAPYNVALGEHLAELIFSGREAQYPPGTDERREFLMGILNLAYPSARVTEAYLANLDLMFARREKLATPGQIVIGLGTGRSGSTTISAIVRSIEGAISTHENPPGIFWQPLSQQVNFHLKRFSLLSRYFPVVFDCSHWWLNMLDIVFRALPSAKAIAMHRETEACVASISRITPGRSNRMVVPYNHIWPSQLWDATHPSYEVPRDAKREPRQAVTELIRRYVTEYNDRLHEIAASMPERVLLLRTEELDAPETRTKISQFLGVSVSNAAVHKNLGGVDDSESGTWWY